MKRMTSAGGIEMDANTWERMSKAERELARDLTDLSPQLVPWKGWRVEVVTDYGETRRFIVGQSTGWRPCSLEISRRNSTGGAAAEKHYKSVKALYKVR